jgi:hypothetical protein
VPRQHNERHAGPWRENARCRACGHRRHGGYSPFDTICPGCGTTARWAWQLWNTVYERPVGLILRHWEQRPDDSAFVADLGAPRRDIRSERHVFERWLRGEITTGEYVATVQTEKRHRLARLIAPFRGRERSGLLREWAGQDRTEAWIARQLETSERRVRRRLRRMGLR